MSSWGIRMELLWIAMRAPCHQGAGSLHLAHADGPPCDARHSSFHPGRNSVRPTFHLLWISHIRYLTPNWRGGRFNFPDQTCPDPLITLTRRASTTDNSNSPDSLARQTLAIHRIHFRPQSSAPLDFNRHKCFFFIIRE